MDVLSEPGATAGDRTASGSTARPERITRRRVTVVVPTKNEEANIGRFLASLDPGVHLVAIDSSTDTTPDLIERLRPERTTVVRARATIPVARQLGAELAETDWVLFTDADVVFAEDYFTHLETLELDPREAGVVGAKSTDGGFDRYHRWFVRGQGALNALGVPAASGSNMLVRAAVVDEVGGFDTQLTVNEDTELMFRVRKAGHWVRFEPGLTVRSFDHRRLEAGLVRKVVHGAVRNTSLWFGWFDRGVRNSDWGYWADNNVDPAVMTDGGSR